MRTTGVITMVQPQGRREVVADGAAKPSWMPKEEAREGRGGDGGGEEKILDLCRAVQNAADELDQLLHGVDRLAGQEVLLVGCVEDDDRGHRHLAEKQEEKKEKQETQLLIFSASVTA